MPQFGSITYIGGCYRLQIFIEDGYPFKVPKVYLKTRVMSVNVINKLDGTGTSSVVVILGYLKCFDAYFVS